jgi:hypothetical protein
LKAAKPLIKQKYSVVFLYSWRNFWAWCIGFSSSLRRRSCTCICALRFGIRHFRCNTLHKQPPHTKDGKCMDIKLYTYTYIHIHTYIHTHITTYLLTYTYVHIYVVCTLDHMIAFPVTVSDSDHCMGPPSNPPTIQTLHTHQPSLLASNIFQ